MKKTYKELGQNSTYKYDDVDIGRIKKVTISNTISSLNIVSGDSNGIRNMIRSINHIGSEVKVLESGCCSGCENLTRINIPQTIEEIGRESFKDCKSLSCFKDDVFVVNANIGSNSFENCGFQTLEISTLSKPDRQIHVGEYAFKDNKNLTDVSMNNIVFGKRMFDGCDNLSNIRLEEGSNIIHQSEDSLAGTPMISSIVLPSSIKEYTDIIDNFLRGSNITEICANGFDFEQADIATGEKEFLYSEYDDSPATSNIKLGTIYKFLNDEEDSAQDQVQEFFANAINEHIPVIQIHCNDECGYCKTFKSCVLDNSGFISWFQDQKCVIAYLQTKWDSKNEESINCGPNSSYSFKYRNFNNYVNDYMIGKEKHVIKGNFSDRIPKYTKKIVDVDNKYYRLVTDGRLNEMKLQFVVQDDEGNHTIDISEPYSAFYRTPAYTQTGYYPTLGFLWKRQDDITISQNKIVFSDQQKHSFLTGKDFTITYKSENLDTYEHIFKSYVEKDEQKQYYEKFFSINGKTVKYYYQVTKNGLNKKTNNIEICVERSMLYLKTIERLGFDGVSYNTSSVNAFKKTVTSFIEKIFNSSEIEGDKNNSKITTIQKYGDCWGIEHDCTVYDKDGNSHEYKYAPKH